MLLFLFVGYIVQGCVRLDPLRFFPVAVLVFQAFLLVV